MNRTEAFDDLMVNLSELILEHGDKFGQTLENGGVVITALIANLCQYAIIAGMHKETIIHHLRQAYDAVLEDMKEGKVL